MAFGRRRQKRQQRYAVPDIGTIKEGLRSAPKRSRQVAAHDLASLLAQTPIPQILLEELRQTLMVPQLLQLLEDDDSELTLQLVMACLANLSFVVPETFAADNYSFGEATELMVRVMKTAPLGAQLLQYALCLAYNLRKQSTVVLSLLSDEKCVAALQSASEDGVLLGAAETKRAKAILARLERASKPTGHEPPRRQSTSQKLVRRMSRRASSTMQHSVEAAVRIQAAVRALLGRRERSRRARHHKSKRYKQFRVSDVRAEMARPMLQPVSRPPALRHGMMHPMKPEGTTNTTLAPLILPGAHKPTLLAPLPIPFKDPGLNGRQPLPPVGGQPHRAQS